MTPFKIKTWSIPSSSTPGRIYAVARDSEGHFVCSCPHWLNRLRDQGGECHHIKRAQKGFITRRPEIVMCESVKMPRFDADTFQLRLSTGRETITQIESALFLLKFGYSKRETWEVLDLPRSWTVERIERYLEYVGK